MDKALKKARAEKESEENRQLTLFDQQLAVSL